MFQTPGTAAGPSKLLILLAQQLLHDALLSPTALIDYVWDTHGTVDALHVASVHPVINPKTDQSGFAMRGHGLPRFYSLTLQSKRISGGSCVTSPG